MLLVYENRTDGIVAEWKKPVHLPPHLHEAIEVVYVTDGDIELGVGQELYHMDEGEFAIVFPNVIHHYQVFGEKESKVIYLYLDPTLFSSYYKELQIYSQKNPVVKKTSASRCSKCYKISGRNNRGESNADTGIRFVCKQICVIKNVCKNLSL